MLKAIKILMEEKRQKGEQSKDLFEMSSDPFLYLNIVLNKLPELNKQRVRKLPLSTSIYSP